MTGQPRFRDRDPERGALDRFLDAVRAGESPVLVVSGEAGVGKSALLDYLIEKASGCRVARANGNEYEMELAYAGLHQLCAPMLELRERLPAPQRDALAAAFGLSSAQANADRFLVGLAVLGLLAEAAEEQPLVCVIDDAHWLDKTSALALAFVARRLLAESVGLVFVVREPNDMPELGGLPELTVGGLDDDNARSLLDSALPGRLDDRVRDRLIAESRGNPLALLEVPRGLSASELAGGFGLPDVTPLPNLIEQSFLRRLEPLPPETRRLLLIAAAEPAGDAPLLWRAADHLGLEADAAAPAQTAGLVDGGALVRFRHPLVRSAVYRAATRAERQETHRALAEATDPAADPDRRAWHRAQAADGRDEDVAGELERSADRARARGGVAAAAAFLERAVELTPDPANRGRRALAAAQARFEAGAPDGARALLAIAETCLLDELQTARLAHLHAQMAFVFGRGDDGPRLLVEAAQRLGALDPAAARDTYLEALGAAMYAGRTDSESGVREVAGAARAAPVAPPPPRPIDLVLDGLAQRCTDGPHAGVPALRLAFDAVRDERLDGHAEIMRWLLLTPIVQSMTVFELWDDEAFHTLAERAVQLARDTGALALLPVTLVYKAGAHVFGGDLTGAEALLEEADAIATATGNPSLIYGRFPLVAWRGVEAEATELIGIGLENTTGRSEGRVLALAGYASAVLNNGLGRYEAAMDIAKRASDEGDFGYSGVALLEVVEAATRSGRPEVAAVAVSRLEDRTRAAGTDWALGVLARARALIEEGDAADELYREAVERLGRTRVRVEHARAHLLYGEWLRRENRRVDAREQLRAAHEMFSSFGAEAFAERARRELRATGETARKRTEQTRGVLTPQEAQIAQLAQDGLSNPEIGAQLFISPRTVQYHLHKVFLKLEITSRNQLARLPANRLSPA